MTPISKLLKPFFILVILLCVIDLKAQTNGCYSLSTGRFYYVPIGSNNYDGDVFATFSSTATCSTFSSGNYTSNLCRIESTSSNNYRQATTNLIYPCPVDGYVFFLVIFIGGLSIIYIFRTKAVDFSLVKS